MEVFDVSKLKSLAYQSINQHGRGGDIDRYIYQQGDGIANLLGSLFKKAVPFIGRTIKGIGSVAKPHLIAAGKDLVNAGAKKGVEELVKLGSKKRKTKHTAHNTKKARWQNL